MANGFRTTWQRLAQGQLTLADLWLLLPPLGLLIVLNLSLVRPYDFWWHLRTGQIIVEAGSIPTIDLFSFTRSGLPWTNQGWLAQVAYYLFYRTGGLPLVIFGHALAIAAGYTLVELACLRSSGGQARAAAGATFVAALLSIFNWNVRPQSASFLLFGAVVFVLESHRARGGRIAWALPVLFALWVNLHGGFAFGVLLMGIYVLARVAEGWIKERALEGETRRLLAAGVASLLALSLNPGGPLGIVRYILSLSQSKAVQDFVLEWMPLNVRTIDGQLLVGAVVLFLVIVYWRRITLPPYLFAALLTFGVLSFYSRRVEPWFGMSFAPAFALAFARRCEPDSATAGHGKPRLNAALVGLVGLLALISLPWWRPYLPLPTTWRSYVAVAETPVQATQELCRLGRGVRLFNDMGYGSYVIWACREVPVFIDTRIELYPAAAWREYFLVSDGQFGWEAVLAKYSINTILANKERQKLLAAAAQASGAWRTIYEDDQTVLLSLK
jgi:hypothetical protein